MSIRITDRDLAAFARMVGDCQPGGYAAIRTQWGIVVATMQEDRSIVLTEEES